MTAAPKEPAAAPLFSLCIPTYNRAESLRAALRGVLEGVERLGAWDAVEVCVSDNCSPDHTPAVVEEARASAPPLRLAYNRQATNVGMIRNVAGLLRSARGEFVCLMGDDDALTDDGLAGLLDAAGRGRDLVILNSYPGGDTLWYHRVNVGAGEAEIRDPAHLIRSLGIFHVSFLTNMVMRRSACLRHLDRCTPRYYDSLYLHSCLALSMLAEAPALFLDRVVVKVDESLRDWNQSLLTAIDMARVQTELVLRPSGDRRLAEYVYRFLVRQVPNAVYVRRRDGARPVPANPFNDLALANVLDCYRRSRKYQAVAAAFWLAGHCLPLALLGRLLGGMSARNAARIKAGHGAAAGTESAGTFLEAHP